MTDEFDYTNITSIWPDEISIGISFSANQEILWSGSETSSYQVVDESEEDKRSEFTASSSVSYAGGVDTLAVANSIGLTARSTRTKQVRWKSPANTRAATPAVPRLRAVRNRRSSIGKIPEI